MKLSSLHVTSQWVQLAPCVRVLVLFGRMQCESYLRLCDVFPLLSDFTYYSSQCSPTEVYSTLEHLPCCEHLERITLTSNQSFDMTTIFTHLFRCSTVTHIHWLSKRYWGTENIEPIHLTDTVGQLLYNCHQLIELRVNCRSVEERIRIDRSWVPTHCVVKGSITVV